MTRRWKFTKFSQDKRRANTLHFARSASEKSSPTLLSTSLSISLTTLRSCCKMSSAFPNTISENRDTSKAANIETTILLAVAECAGAAHKPHRAAQECGTGAPHERETFEVPRRFRLWVAGDFGEGCGLKTSTGERAHTRAQTATHQETI